MVTRYANIVRPAHLPDPALALNNIPAMRWHGYYVCDRNLKIYEASLSHGDDPHSSQPSIIYARGRFDEHIFVALKGYTAGNPYIHPTPTESTWSACNAVTPRWCPLFTDMAEAKFFLKELIEARRTKLLTEIEMLDKIKAAV